METVTFYSYKGGTGRSLLLANAAQFLALTGKRVVALDLDFEAPGLHYKVRIGPLGQRTADVVPERGVVEYLLAANDGGQPERLLDYVLPVALPPRSGQLWLMPAGAAPSGEYWRSLTALVERGALSVADVDTIASFLDLQLRLEDELEADFLLIDARTGITELAGLATTLLADTVVCLMLDNPESLAGTRVILRSLGRAVRLEGQAPVEVLAVLSRVRHPDRATEQRVLSYLNEPAGPNETLSIERLYVLPDEPSLAHTERVLLDGGRDGAESVLGRGYLALMRALAPTKESRSLEAFRRQWAMPAMRAALIDRDAPWNNGRAGIREDDIEEGLALGDPESRYADLAVFAADDRTTPFLVAEYVQAEAWEPEPSERARKWWRDHTRVPWLVTFTFEPGGRLDWRAFKRSVDPGDKRGYHFRSRP